MIYIFMIWLFTPGLSLAQEAAPPEPSETAAPDSNPTSNNPAAESEITESESEVTKPMEDKPANDAKQPASSPMDKPEGSAATPVEPIKPAGNMYLGAGIGFNSINGGLGTWGAAFASEISGGYLLTKIIDMDFWLTGRYVPIDIVSEKDNNVFRGVIEGWHIGGALIIPTSKMKIVGQAELGLLSTSLKPLDGYTGKIDQESLKINILVGGGTDWQLGEGVKIGPRLFLGYGGLQTTQLSCQTSFLF